MGRPWAPAGPPPGPSTTVATISPSGSAGTGSRGSPRRRPTPAATSASVNGASLRRCSRGGSSSGSNPS